MSKLTFSIQPMRVEDGGQGKRHGGKRCQDAEETKWSPQFGFPQIIFLTKLA